MDQLFTLGTAAHHSYVPCCSSLNKQCYCGAAVPVVMFALRCGNHRLGEMPLLLVLVITIIVSLESFFFPLSCTRMRCRGFKNQLCFSSISVGKMIKNVDHQEISHSASIVTHQVVAGVAHACINTLLASCSTGETHKFSTAAREV